MIKQLKTELSENSGGSDLAVVVEELQIQLSDLEKGKFLLSRLCLLQRIE